MAERQEGIERWAVSQMAVVVQAAHRLGIDFVAGSPGSPIWRYWYSWRQTPTGMVDAGFSQIKEPWPPVFDIVEDEGGEFAFEVHPSDLAFRSYRTERLLETFEHRSTLGLSLYASRLL